MKRYAKRPTLKEALRLDMPGLGELIEKINEQTRLIGYFHDPLYIYWSECNRFSDDEAYGKWDVTWSQESARIFGHDEYYTTTSRALLEVDTNWIKGDIVDADQLEAYLTGKID